MLALATGSGAAVMWGLSWGEDFTLQLLGTWRSPSVVIAAVAASHEEVAKIAVVRWSSEFRGTARRP